MVPSILHCVYCLPEYGKNVCYKIQGDVETKVNKKHIRTLPLQYQCFFPRNPFYCLITINATCQKILEFTVTSRINWLKCEKGLQVNKSIKR